MLNLSIDVDECTKSTPVCDNNAVCNNTHGGYNCTCKPGYTGDGHNCTGEIQNFCFCYDDLMKRDRRTQVTMNLA